MLQLQSGAASDEPAVPVGVRAPVLLGFATIFLFFGGFMGWAAVAPLDSASIAPGVVKVESDRKTVQHLEGGIVREINAREGDRVRAGEVLIRLEDTQPRASLDLLHVRMMAAIALDARLVAERDGRNIVTRPIRLHNGPDDATAREIIDAQIRIFDARRKTMSDQIAILGQRIAQFAEEINGLNGQIGAEERQIALLDQEIKSMAELVAKGVAPRPPYLELQRRLAELEGMRSQNLARIAQVGQSIGETRLQIAGLRTARTDEVVQQLRDTQAEQFELAERIRSAQDILRRTEIRAPIDGKIVALKVHTPGGVIGPGEPLLDLVPSDDRLVIDARVDPRDIDVVHAGLRALVRLTAFNQRNLPPLEGIVTSVSADRLSDERTGQAYYLARVEPDEILVQAQGAIQPGMQAEVMIVTGARTALESFLNPISRSLNRAFRED